MARGWGEGCVQASQHTHLAPSCISAPQFALIKFHCQLLLWVGGLVLGAHMGKGWVPAPVEGTTVISREPAVLVWSKVQAGYWRDLGLPGQLLSRLGG